MTTFAVIGAGPGLGVATARAFGRRGLAVALVARDQRRLDRLTEDLQADGITAAGFSADVRDATALAGVLQQAADQLGPIEVLQYSPIPARQFLKPVADTDAHDLRAALDFSLLGPYAAVRAVLPEMQAAGRGSILFVNGGSAVRPNPKVAGTSVAFAAESAYAALLHETLAADGVHVGQLIVPGGIAEGDPLYDPAILAERLWSMHAEPGAFRVFAGPLET